MYTSRRTSTDAPTAAVSSPLTVPAGLSLFVTRFLLGCMAMLVAGYAATRIANYGYGHDTLLGLTRLFDLAGEGNLPAWFSSVLLLLAAGCLGMIAAVAAARHDRWARRWAGLSAVFVALSADETASVHEMISDIVEKHGYVLGWVIPALLLVAVVAWSYHGFMEELPRATRRRILLAAVMYVGGAMGVETVELLYYAAYRIGTGPFIDALVLIEETLEMAGMIVFIGALLEHLRAALALDTRGGVPAAAQPHGGGAARAASCTITD